MISFLVDTGYLIALEAADDQYHKAALHHWNSLIENLPRLVISSYVFDEVVTFFNSRNQHVKAIEIGNNILSSPSVQFVHVDENLFQEGWLYLKKHDDKTYSLTDCISFVLMDRHGIQTALTFDSHFIQAGFAVLPLME